MNEKKLEKELHKNIDEFKMPEIPVLNLGEKANSTDVLINPHTNSSVRSERLVEVLGSLVQKVMSGNLDGINPMVIGVKDGKMIVEDCLVDKEGNVSLPPIRVNSIQDIKLKSKFVRKLLSVITPVLHADIENVTFMALMRKDSDKLKQMMDELSNGVQPKLENRVGCIWLVIGNYEVIL